MGLIKHWNSDQIFPNELEAGFSLPVRYWYSAVVTVRVTSPVKIQSLPMKTVSPSASDTVRFPPKTKNLLILSLFWQIQFLSKTIWADHDPVKLQERQLTRYMII